MKRRDGFTLLEMMIALTILALVSVNISMVTRTGSQAARSGVFWATLNDEADLTLDRISLAVMSAEGADIYPVAVAPNFTSNITYSVSLGVEDGEVVESPPEAITYDEVNERGRIVWARNPGLAEEYSVTWSNWVPHLQIDEVANGSDDNDNELTDESGLSFDMQGETVNIRLTIERQNPDGKWIPVPRTITVTPRN